MDHHDIKGWIDTATSTINLMKSAASALPKNQPRADIEDKLLITEESMKRSDAKLAKEFGLRLYDCTFPPQIMLLSEPNKAHVCPNPDCRRAIKKPTAKFPSRAGGCSRHRWMAS